MVTFQPQRVRASSHSPPAIAVHPAAPIPRRKQEDKRDEEEDPSAESQRYELGHGMHLTLSSWRSRAPGRSGSYPREVDGNRPAQNLRIRQLRDSQRNYKSDKSGERRRISHRVDEFLGLCKPRVIVVHPSLSTICVPPPETRTALRGTSVLRG